MGSKRATLAKDPQDVAGMFDMVASKYDLMNGILTGGLVKYWRKKTTQMLQIRPGMKVLDLAAGTGTSAQNYAKAGAEVVACDFSPGMIAEGKKRYPHLHFVEGDAMNLPFAADTFDVVTISYGLRNVHDPALALREMLRVTKPGGRIVVCEFSRPQNALFRGVYKIFLHTVMPLISRFFSSDAQAYGYLAESILAWPPQPELATYLTNAGWMEVGYKNLTNGLVALHYGKKK